MRREIFSKKPVAVAVAMASLVGTAAQSQEQAPEPARADNMVIEEVYVTGIRSSLKRAMDTKRDSAGVVDAITAEDIGDFPDTNLAEALQRITGVAIDRQRGEGTTVTVRGFGADFNLVTLNGRQMPTHSGFGRSFDFQDIAAESVSGVEVYKTSRANIPTGGIGATINVLTAKPLDKPGLRTSLSAKGVYDESTREGDDLTPELSAFISQTFFDDTVGIAVSGTFQERHNGSSSAFNTAFLERFGSAIPDNGQQTNLPAADDLVSLPQQVVYQLDEWERTRINGQITLQWEPIETLTMTLDYTMAELELDHRYNNMSVWFSPTGQSGTWSDGPIVSPITYFESNNQPDLPMGAGIDASRNIRDGIGFNLDWDATDRLRFMLDWHDSTAKREPNSRFGSSATLSMAAFGRQSARVDYSQELPVTTVVMADPLSPDDMQITGSVFSNSWAEMNIEQTRFAGAFDLTDTITLDFGVTHTDLDNFEAGSIVQRNTWGQNQASAYGTVADLVVPASLAGMYDELSGGDQVTNNFFIYNMEEVVERAEFLQSLPPSNPLHLATATTDGDCGTGFCADSDPGFGNQFREETLSFYLQMSYMGELFRRPFNLRAGYRYEETDVTASAESEDYLRIDWASTNEFSAVPATTTVASNLEGDYDVGLPNIDFDIEIIDDLVFRASYSETVARAGFGDLRGNLSIGQVLRVVEGEHIATGTVGNPGLMPHESQNWDFSLEWYYGDASYVSIGYFDKSVENFVASAEQQDVVLFDNLAHPALGPLYADAVAALGITASNGAIRDYIFTNFPNAEGVDVANQVITGVPGRDAPAYFDVSTRVNSDREANIDGWEFAWQHNFWETGIGFIFNLTLADGSAVFDNRLNTSLAGLPGQFALPGLSDTRNFVLFYENDSFQIRAAYNWRDSHFTGGDVIPSYTEEYQQWDASASYEFESGLALFVEAINITNETYRSHGRDPLQLFNVGQIGARYNFGIRYSY
jgi:TonB-dependent receptor